MENNQPKLDDTHEIFAGLSIFSMLSILIMEEQGMTDEKLRTYLSACIRDKDLKRVTKALEFINEMSKQAHFEINLEEVLKDNKISGAE